MNSAKSFAFPARNRLDALQHEQTRVRDAELQAALADAIARGFAEGLAHGRDAAHTEAREAVASAYREGLERGHAAGLAEMETVAAALQGALDGFNRERVEIVAEAEAFCVDLALAVVARVIEADKARAEFIRRATAAALVALAPEAPTAVFLCPADLKLVGKHMSGLPLQEDNTLAAGTSRVEAGRLLVESSIEEALAQLRAAVIEVKHKRTGPAPDAGAEAKRDAL